MASDNVNVIDLLKAAGATSLAVASAATAYSNSFKLSANRSFGLEVQLDVSSGTPDVKIELEASGSAPATEGSADTNFVVPQALGGGVNPDSVIDASCNTELIRFYPLPPVVAPYQRFKFTGQGTNPASCVVTKLRVYEIGS